MSRDPHTGGTVNLPEPPEEEQVQILARMVADEKQFREILKTANPALRRKVYDQIKPHLRFKVRPFFMLMR